MWDREQAEVNPLDAEKLELETGSRVIVTSRRGQVSSEVKVSDRVMPGMIWMSFHHTATPTNELTSHHLDPITGTGEYKVCAVRIEKIE
jgi:formate dehydrogenase alpha subunit